MLGVAGECAAINNRLPSHVPAISCPTSSGKQTR